MRRVVKDLYMVLLTVSSDTLRQHYGDHQGDLIEKAEIICGLYNYIHERSYVDFKGNVVCPEFEPFLNKDIKPGSYIVDMSVYEFITTILWNIVPNDTPFLRTLGLMAIAIQSDEDATHSLLLKCSYNPTSVWAGEEAYERICTPEFLTKFMTLYVALKNKFASQETELFS